MKVKSVKKTPEKRFLDTRAKKIAFGTVVGVILLISSVLMFLESSVKCQLTVQNNTDIDLEYVKAKYVTSEIDLTDYAQVEKIDANKSLTIDAIPYNLGGIRANYNIAFKFAGHDELYADAGAFSDNYKGKIKISFSKTDDPDKLKMTVKADAGLFKSRLIDCDEVFTVDFKNGVVYD